MSETTTTRTARACHGIRLGAQGDGLRIDVQDDGPGVSPADRETIFERFRQAGDTLTGKPRGTGLGLPISRRIVEHFGGRLWLEDRAEAGATFSFSLPLAPPRPAGPAPTMVTAGGG